MNVGLVRLCEGIGALALRVTPNLSAVFVQLKGLLSCINGLGRQSLMMVAD